LAVAYIILTKTCKIKTFLAVAVRRPALKAEQRRMKEEEIASEQKAHETEMLTDVKNY